VVSEALAPNVAPLDILSGLRADLRSAMRLTAGMLAATGGEVRVKPDHIQSLHPGDSIETRIDLVTGEMVVTLVKVRQS
jgi:hypothetical protein